VKRSHARPAIVVRLATAVVTLAGVGALALAPAPTEGSPAFDPIRREHAPGRSRSKTTTSTTTTTVQTTTTTAAPAPTTTLAPTTTTAPPTTTTTAPPVTTTTVAPTTTTTAPATTTTTTTAPPTTTTTTAPPAAPSPLAANAPGAAHDARPHGVPSGYSWSGGAVLDRLTPPSADSAYMNLWGHLYADDTNIRPANTRVAVSRCELWALPPTGTAWVRLQGSASLEGGAWSEDYTRNGGPYSIRNEADGSQSFVTADGWNAHFWTRASLALVPTGTRAFVTACSARLVLADPAGVDDRASARYLLGLGADWRTSTYGCPVVGGITVCSGVGVGRFTRVTTEWQRVVFSSVLAGDVATTPPLPAAALTP
jgi:hypothetical protein